jgi:hypothetical protein
MMRSLKLLVSLMFIFVISCNDPETVVINYVHIDGSVTRKIEMRTHEGDINKRFKISDIQVPLDSTWTIRDSVELDRKGDKTWVRRAEKHFKSAEEINLSYKSDSGSNKGTSRKAGFIKRFRWFNTEYRFSESIDKKFAFGYPVKDYLNKEELQYFYSPENLKNEKEASSDSIRYKALSDTVKAKTDKWTTKNFISEWIGEFSKLTKGKSGTEMSYESLKSHENHYVNLIEKSDRNLDSLWKNGILLKEFIGQENAVRFKTEADSALSLVTNNLLANFEDYSIRIVMPGKLIATNGFIDGEKKLIWPVKSDYFLTEKYDMWAESKITNTWAWIVSGFFLLFVLAGVGLRIIKKD